MSTPWRMPPSRDQGLGLHAAARMKVVQIAHKRHGLGCGWSRFKTKLYFLHWIKKFLATMTVAMLRRLMHIPWQKVPFNTQHTGTIPPPVKPAQPPVRQVRAGKKAPGWIVVIKVASVCDYKCDGYSLATVVRTLDQAQESFRTRLKAVGRGNPQCEDICSVEI